MKINKKVHIRKKGAGAGKLRKNPVQRFIIYNKTDGVPASPNVFPSRLVAERFIHNFRERFKNQGYYLTARGQRIRPEDIKLIIQKY